MAEKIDELSQRRSRTRTRGFDELHQELIDWVCTLKCTSAALEQAHELDDSEVGSAARRAIRLCAENLNRLKVELGEAHESNLDPLPMPGVQADRRRRAGARPPSVPWAAEIGGLQPLVMGRSVDPEHPSPDNQLLRFRGRVTKAGEPTISACFNWWDGWDSQRHKKASFVGFSA